MALVSQRLSITRLSGVIRLRRNWLSVEGLEQSNEKHQKAGKESTAIHIKPARQDSKLHLQKLTWTQQDASRHMKGMALL